MVSIYINFADLESKTFMGSSVPRYEMKNSPGKLGAVRTRGPDGKIRTAEARGISQSDSRI